MLRASAKVSPVHARIIINMKQWTMSSARLAYHGRQLTVVVLMQDERQAVVAEQHLPV